MAGIVRPQSELCLSGAEAEQLATPTKTKRNLLSPPSAREKSFHQSGSPPASPTCPRSPCRRVSKDNFNLIKLLGTGAYSRVALVEEVGTNRTLAMKVMEKAFLKSVRRKTRSVGEEGGRSNQGARSLVRVDASWNNQASLLFH